MTPFEELDALGRIFTVIKAYRQEKNDYLDPRNNDLVNSYLVKHLVAEDLQLWLRLKNESKLSFDDATTAQRFRRLLGQYKRASYELIESWHQSHYLN